MTRRGLLASLMAAATMDPERLLWVPGKKLISVPKPQERILLVSEMLMTPQLEALKAMQLHVRKSHVRYFNTTPVIGMTINVRKPKRWQV